MQVCIFVLASASFDPQLVCIPVIKIFVNTCKNNRNSNPIPDDVLVLKYFVNLHFKCLGNNKTRALDISFFYEVAN